MPTFPLREYGEIRHGNSLLFPCFGKKKDGSQHCCGMIRVPFNPPLPGCQLAEPVEGQYWIREQGETLDDLTLKQSVEAYECGHVEIKNGQMIVTERISDG